LTASSVAPERETSGKVLTERCGKAVPDRRPFSVALDASYLVCGLSIA
jgi:hypothetical protein